MNVHLTTPTVVTARFRLPGLAYQLPTMASIAQLTVTPHPSLQSLHDELIAPFRHRPTTDEVTIALVGPDTYEAGHAAMMLNWGYCSHYHTGEHPPALPVELFDPRAHTYTLAAYLTLGDTKALVGTLQVVIGDTVPALSLFEAADGAQLPHEPAGAGPIAELRRFSVSPILEVAPLPDDPLNVVLREFRSRIYRELYTFSLKLFRATRVRVVYGIATPEIYRFFTRSGMPMRRLEETVLVDSAEVRALQHQFARYWRPTAPLAQQPALYQILVPTHGAPKLTGSCRTSVERSCQCAEVACARIP
ncbi:hypothetical protein [Mycobacterium sp.]|uniref:hypothetical protein n=1 Tax=Mycobacterium sp. TaxID=1785 RepID=UPI002C268BA7|nr:hypothetical protein [Mycobacterium sp.]HTQ18334.1 hypothetical protein [Mycobacterium sp.]